MASTAHHALFASLSTRLFMRLSPYRRVSKRGASSPASSAPSHRAPLPRTLLDRRGHIFQKILVEVGVFFRHRLAPRIIFWRNRAPHLLTLDARVAFAAGFLELLKPPNVLDAFLVFVFAASCPPLPGV
jgi:hypothetical protein